MMHDLNLITGAIVDTAYRLHSRVGPGLLESAYEAILAHALEKRGLHVERQKAVPFEWEGIRVEEVCRLDLFVEGCVVVELKSLERLHRVHHKQVLTYLRLLDLPVGLLDQLRGGEPAEWSASYPGPQESPRRLDRRQQAGKPIGGGLSRMREGTARDKLC